MRAKALDEEENDEEPKGNRHDGVEDVGLSDGDTPHGGNNGNGRSQDAIGENE